jgi:hypothetical protein
MKVAARRPPVVADGTPDIQQVLELQPALRVQVPLVYGPAPQVERELSLGGGVGTGRIVVTPGWLRFVVEATVELDVDVDIGTGTMVEAKLDVVGTATTVVLVDVEAEGGTGGPMVMPPMFNWSGALGHT